MLTLALLVLAGCGSPASSDGANTPPTGPIVPTTPVTPVTPVTPTPPPTPATISVRVSPTTASLLPGDTLRVVAAVDGSTNQSVTWQVQEGAAGGTVTDSGRYTAPSTVGVYHVVATSAASTAATGMSTITVVPQPTATIAITPQSASLPIRGTLTLTASVTGSVPDAPINWSVQEADGGTITAAGVYTAPALPGTFHIVARRTVAPVATASIPVTVTPVVAIGLAPASVSMLTGDTVTFAASVTGTRDTLVTWSVQEGAVGGSVQSNGRYIAPATAGTYHVRATSVSDGTKSATATVVVGARPVSASVLRYNIDRSAVPQQIGMRELTLRIFVGTATSVTATADGQAVRADYNATTGWVNVTTAGSVVQVFAADVNTAAAGFGNVAKAVLRDDKKWAYSFGFDDNVSFKVHGIPFAESLGFRGTLFVMNKGGDTLFPNGRNEGWILDEGDLPKLVKGGTISNNTVTFTTTGGWSIGNHSWSHSVVSDLGGASGATADIIRMQDLLRRILDANGLASYKIISFAAPMFDSQYQPVINTIRTSDPAHQIIFNESGSNSPIQVDGPFNLGTSVPRWNTSTFGTGSTDDPLVAVNAFRADNTKHYWLNTLDHGVDDDYPSAGYYKWLKYVHDKWGAGGTNEVWVAPSDRIVSYLVTRDLSRVTRQ